MSRFPSGVAFLGLVLFLCLVLQGPALGGVSVSVFPETTRVDPDQDFTIYLWIDVAADEFDAYETVVNFNNSHVDLISVVQETVMTDACGNNWFQTNIGDSDVFISHAFLCPGATATGPGALSSLNFTAHTSGTSEVVFEYIDFFLSGILNQDVTSRNGIVTVTGGSSAPEGGLLDSIEPSLDIFPNPVGELATLRFGLDRAGPTTLSLFDVRGRRIVNLISTRVVEAGTHSVAWSRGDASLDLPRGVYYWRLLTGEGQVVRRMILND
jgi:hypothetical protein